MTALIELYANDAFSTLANSIDSTSGTINLAPGTGSRFPIPVFGSSYFRLVITSQTSPNSTIEIVTVIARVNDALTVTRGQDGTTAQSWNVGDLVTNQATAGTYKAFQQLPYGDDTGVLNAYVVSTPQNATAYYSGMEVFFITPTANSGSFPRINVNGLGEKFIRNPGGLNILPGQIQINTVNKLTFNAQNDWFELNTPPGVAITPNAGDNSTRIATTAFVQTAVAGFPSGTSLPFYQAAAPSGWVRNTAVNNAALRISSVGGNFTTGPNFTTTFAVRTLSGSVGATALTVNQMPAHTHAISDPGHTHAFVDPGHVHTVFDVGHNHGITDPGHVHTDNGQNPGGNYVTGGYGNPQSWINSHNTGRSSTNISINTNQTGISLNPAFTGASNVSNGTGITALTIGGGAVHTHALNAFPLDMSVAYADFIICSKS